LRVHFLRVLSPRPPISRGGTVGRSYAMGSLAVLVLLISLGESSGRQGLMPRTEVPAYGEAVASLEEVRGESRGARRKHRETQGVSCFGDDDEVGGAVEGTTSLLEISETATPGDYGQFFMKLVPGVHGKLYGRTLVAPCRCEACAYVLDTLVMYLDEDTMGWFLPDDVEHVIQDRFCYGVKWIYRSACHHILSAYYEEVVTMVMGHLTGVDMCRVLRFCPFHFSSGNWMWPQKNPLAFK